MDEPATPDAAPAVAGTGVKRLSVRQQLTLSLLWFSLNFETAALLPIVIPAQLLLFVTPGSVGNASQAVALGALSALGALIALVAQPLTGAASDRTRSRLGRRRPYVLAAAAIYLVGMLTLAWAPGFVIFALGFVLAQIAANVGTAAYQGLLPDRVPVEQRGTASGFLGLMTILGNVGSLVAAGLLLGSVVSGPGLEAEVRSGAARFYALGIVVLIVGTVVTVVGIREEPVRALDTQPPFLELWLAPLRHANFRWVFLTRGSVMLGLTLFLTFIEYYFANVAHVTNFIQSTAAVALLALAGALVGALTLGTISDRIGRVGIVAVATGLMTLAALTFVIAPHVPLWPLGLVFGAGYGALHQRRLGARGGQPAGVGRGRQRSRRLEHRQQPARRARPAGGQPGDRQCQRARHQYRSRLSIGLRPRRRVPASGRPLRAEGAGDRARTGPGDQLEMTL